VVSLTAISPEARRDVVECGTPPSILRERSSPDSPLTQRRLSISRMRTSRAPRRRPMGRPSAVSRWPRKARSRSNPAARSGRGTRRRFDSTYL